MKKTFKLSHEKLNTARLVESIKHEVKKYIKRERRREIPEGYDFWDFDCRYGSEEDLSEVIHMSEISKSISLAESEQLDSFYLEIMAKPRRRMKKTPTEEN